MKFSAVFLSALAGSALANPVPNADNKRAELDARVVNLSPIGTRPVAGAAQITNVFGPLSMLPISENIPSGTASAAQIWPLIDRLRQNAASMALLAQVLSGGLPALPGTATPSLPNIPVNVTVPATPALPANIGQLSPEVYGAILEAFLDYYQSTQNIKSVVPTFLNVPNMNTAQLAAYAENLAFILNTLKPWTAQIQGLGAANIANLGSGATGQLTQLDAASGALGTVLNALRPILTVLGLANLLAGLSI